MPQGRRTGSSPAGNTPTGVGVKTALGKRVRAALALAAGLLALAAGAADPPAPGTPPPLGTDPMDPSPGKPRSVRHGSSFSISWDHRGTFSYRSGAESGSVRINACNIARARSVFRRFEERRRRGIAARMSRALEEARKERVGTVVFEKDGVRTEVRRLSSVHVNLERFPRRMHNWLPPMRKPCGR